MVNHNLCDVNLTEKAIQRVSEVTVNNVMYAVRDVFVIDVYCILSVFHCFGRSSTSLT